MNLVLLSGGLDSTVALAMTVQSGEPTAALAVDYGQRHRKELMSAEWLADYYKVSLTTLQAPHLRKISTTQGHGEGTVVPGRNLMLIGLATAHSLMLGGGRIILGVNHDDAAGYPDCRMEFLRAAKEAVRLGSDNKCRLTAPLKNLTKAEVYKMALRLEVPIEDTWSCYEGKELPCGSCGACQDMAKAVKSCS